MSTAFYPQGMSRNTFPRGYETWKGTGYFSNPIGITSGNIRPYTNRDLANNVIYKFGLPRPIKHYRKGISATTPSNEYQENKEVKSSRGSNLVSQLMDIPGGYSTIQNTINEVDNIEHTNKLCANFQGIAMVNDIYPNVNYAENPPVIMKIGNEPIFIKSEFCCSTPKNALKLLRTSTNLKQNYYTTTYQYLQNRCQTYDQRIFNFAVPEDIIGKPVNVGKPGDPTTIDNYYVANCLPNFIIKEGVELEIIDVVSKRLIDYDPTFKDIILKLKNITSLQPFLQELRNYVNEMPNKEEILIYIFEIVSISSQYLQNLTGNKHCGKVIYKPNNPQFATQGAVTASTYILKKDVVTLETSLQSPQLRKSKGSVDNCKLNTKSSGNRPSSMACLYPDLYNRKYMPKTNNTTQLQRNPNYTSRSTTTLPTNTRPTTTTTTTHTTTTHTTTTTTTTTTPTHTTTTSQPTTTTSQPTTHPTN